MLICCNSSLRFSDSQHVEWSSFVVDDLALRGISWRTKTSKTGCPFGLFCAGFFGGAELSLTWVGRYLSCLNKLWHRVRTYAPQAIPDCLFFSYSAESFMPLSYAAALKTLRTLLVSWGGCPDPSVYTLRSMKSTFLSCMAPVGVPEELRAKQGHHRQTSAQLYSRDDVFPSFGPRSFGGGGQRPLSEPQVRAMPSEVQSCTLELDLFAWEAESAGSSAQGFMFQESALEVPACSHAQEPLLPLLPSAEPAPAPCFVDSDVEASPAELEPEEAALPSVPVTATTNTLPDAPCLGVRFLKAASGTVRAAICHPGTAKVCLLCGDRSCAARLHPACGALSQVSSLQTLDSARLFKRRACAILLENLA